MSAVLRYDKRDFDHSIEVYEDGHYVAYSDYAALLAKSAAYEALVAEIEAAPVGECVLYDVCGMETPVIDLELTAPEAFPYISGMRVRLLLVREGGDG